MINEDLSDNQTLVVDICFDNMRAVYQDMPLIAQQLGVPETSISYHESLLSSYFINDPQDSNPPLLMAFYLFILLLVSVSLILIIHNSFAVSMNAVYINLASFPASGNAGANFVPVSYRKRRCFAYFLFCSEILSESL